jgi:hypothetical protein
MKEGLVLTQDCREISGAIKISMKHADTASKTCPKNDAA